MDINTPVRNTFLGLLRALTGDTRTFIQQEIQLAKTELSEKISNLGKNAAALAVGGFIAYAGAIVLFIGIGFLVAWALEKAGLDAGLASFVGLSAVGLLVTVVGLVLVLKGLKAVRSESLSPQRTLHTLQEMKGSQPVTASEPKEEKVSSSEMQSRVEATENRMGETLDELGRRVSPSHINAEVKRHISAKPYLSGLIAMAAGLVSGLLLYRKRGAEA